MKKSEIMPGVIRITLAAEDSAAFQPIAFGDAEGIFLTQTGFSSVPRPVYRLNPRAGDGAVRQTANGEVVVFDEGETRLVKMSRSAELTFACPAGDVLTGLGQHEDGIFDYACREERLYQHNMKIAVPFLMSSAGWGLLIEAGCAMRYTGKGDGFVFTLDAAEEVSYVVIRAKDCAEVLKILLSLTGKPTRLPKWAFGYIQSKERYKTAEELTETAALVRETGLRIRAGLQCAGLVQLARRLLGGQNAGSGTISGCARACGQAARDECPFYGIRLAEHSQRT